MPDANMLLGQNYEVEDKRVSIKDILNHIFERQNIEQKTILASINIDGIIKMTMVNSYLKKTYGWEIDLYKVCIDEKRLNIISLNGRGRNDILDACRAMQNPIMQEENNKKGLI